jgi:lariat debranching enzyme
MAVPEKYKSMCSFWKYYAGVKKAPVLTIFVGGNHEASNFLSELPYGRFFFLYFFVNLTSFISFILKRTNYNLKGGWVAENIYYMGYANVLNFRGLRIAGLSGIYKAEHFHKGHFEIPPYNQGSIRSSYHVRNLETHRLSQIKAPIDIMITHDWPTGVYHHGNVNQLLRIKPYFKQEVETNTLGSPENERLLKLLKPKHWFSAHLHVKFECAYKHEKSEMVTHFLALDKCLPRRSFMEIISIDEPANSKSDKLCLDPEWLCILKKTDRLLSIDYYNQAPILEKENIEVSTTDLEQITEDFEDCFEVPPIFKPTAPIHNDPNQTQPQDIYLNEQTTLLCEMLNLRDPIRVLLEKRGKSTVINDSKTQLYNNLLDESDEE